MIPVGADSLVTRSGDVDPIYVGTLLLTASTSKLLRCDSLNPEVWSDARIPNRIIHVIPATPILAPDPQPI